MKKIGEFLVERGAISPAEREQILAHSLKTGMRFGEAGVALGVLSHEKLFRVFGSRSKADFFHLDPNHFPLNTLDTMPVADLIRLGALPLGIKRERRFFKTLRTLNLGMLTPENAELEAEARRIAEVSRIPGQEFDRVQLFLILADQMIEVLRDIYGVDEAQLCEYEAPRIHPVLSLFLDPAEERNAQTH